MDVSEYDQYIPEKELNMNFRIPRKRTAEESNAPYYDGGNTAESSQYDATTRSLSDYVGLSGAASKASAHSNYRGPVSYKVDTSIKPPMLPTNLKMSSSQFPNTAAYSKPDSGGLMNKQWQQDISRSQNPSDGCTWPQSSKSSSFLTDNRSQRSDVSSGSQQRNWGNSQWDNAQSKKWDNVQSTTLNSSVSSKWNSAQQLEVNEVQEPRLSSAYSFEWLQSDVNNTQTKWNNERTLNRGQEQESKWDNEHSMWSRRGNPKYADSHAPNWNNRGQDRDNLPNRSAPQWKNTKEDQALPKIDSLFSKSWENRDGLLPLDKPSGWNWSRGDGGGNNFNRGSFGRGGMQKWGSRNDGNNQPDFRRGMSVLDNDNSEDLLFGITPDANPRGFQNNGGQKNSGRYWNKNEKPKKPKIVTPPVVIADTSDETLPKDLRLMFQPLFCKLCSIQMTSNVMAKMHYVSKNHEKKIRKYLIEHAEKTGEPLHPRASLTGAQDKKEKEEDKDPKNFYCELCDLQLTGKQHADSHYMGKSHNAVRMGRKRPAGQGFFDASGKWVRKNKEPKLEYGEGEDTFGMDFKKKTEEPEAPSTSEVAKPQPVAKSSEQFVCSLCVITCVSQDQLNIHFSGSKHKKKLKANGVSPENFILAEENAEQMDSEDATTTVSAEAKAQDPDASLKSKYITPNGFYYCEKCNITVNSEIQFKQHLASKNHAKKANISKTQ